jgi:hypothetical protein
MRIDQVPEKSTVKCPQCGDQGVIEPSRQYLTQHRPNPNWRILNCRRCRRTQYPATKDVELITQPIAKPRPEPAGKAVAHER